MVDVTIAMLALGTVSVNPPRQVGSDWLCHYVAGLVPCDKRGPLPEEQAQAVRVLLGLPPFLTGDVKVAADATLTDQLAAVAAAIEPELAELRAEWCDEQVRAFKAATAAKTARLAEEAAAEQPKGKGK
jgi:hypothetical protein